MSQRTIRLALLGVAVTGILIVASVAGVYAAGGLQYFDRLARPGMTAGNALIPALFIAWVLSSLLHGCNAPGGAP